MAIDFISQQVEKRRLNEETKRLLEASDFMKPWPMAFLNTLKPWGF